MKKKLLHTHKELITELSVEDGDRSILWVIRDGKVEKTDSSLPYHKEKSDWEFYKEAIEELLKEL